MNDEQLWLLIDETITEYIPIIKENASSEDSIDFSILSLLVKLKLKSIDLSNTDSFGIDVHQDYDNVLKEIDQTIEYNRNQFFDLIIH